MTTATSPDLERWSFTDSGPWVLREEDITWLNGLDEVRRATAVEAAKLARPPSAPPVGRVLRTGGELGAALGGWQVFERRDGGAVSRAGVSRRLRRSFEKLGTTYIKLGQIISAGEGIFPRELTDEFKKCRDEVPPQPFSDVRTVIEEDFKQGLYELFATFDRTPMAAASIAQVHAATLTTGEEVVVKVQRPQVASLVRADLKAMAWMAPKLVGRIPIAALANPPAIVELFADTIVEELDFRLEAQNMLDVGEILARTHQRAIVVPRPHPTMVTPRVLVMERLHGHNFDNVEALKDAGVDMKAVIRAGMITTLEGSMLYGVFHGDLHAGNMFVDDDGRVALMDFGITGRLGEERRLGFVKMLMGGVTNDVRSQLQALTELGALPKDTDLDAVIADLGLDRPPVDPTSLSAEELMGEIREIVQKLVGYGASFPKELMLFVKNSLFLDGAIAMHAPDLDLLGEVFQVATHMATKHGNDLAAQVGSEPGQDLNINLDGFKASFGLDSSTETLTYADLQERRKLIRSRIEEHRKTQRRGPLRRRRRRRS